MSVNNGYSRLDLVKGLKRITSVSAPDDLVLERMISAASRFIDNYTNRTFYPRVDTRYYDVPRGAYGEFRRGGESGMSRELLLLDDDLLSLTTLTNGDLSVILPASYVLEDYNETPYWGIRLKYMSNVYWIWDSTGNTERVISVLGEWGYHDNYAGAWFATDTLNGGINASVTALTTTGSALLVQGQIIKIDSEIMQVA
jgi:hypothetical protein